MEERRRIGIICAMEIEAELLIKALENKTEETYAGCVFHKGALNGKDAVVVRCGIGKVNAARITQALIDRYAPRCVINSGIAGGIGDGLRVGDMVIGAGLVQYDFDVSVFGYAKGYMYNGEKDRPTVYRSDPALCAALREAAADTDPARRVLEGIIATGDRFVADGDTKRTLRELFAADAAEMESAAVAQTAQYAGVPFVALRVLSDLADGTAPESYDAFEAETAAFSARVIAALADRL